MYPDAPAGQGAAVNTTASWTAGASGYTLTIQKAAHGRKSGDFVYVIWQLVNGKYVRNTWSLLTADLRYEASAGTVVVESAAAFAGKILFLG